MPIVTGIKRRSPLDINKNIAIGVAFPLDDNNMFKGTETVMEQAKANLLNLLLTYPGERVNLPDFGIGVKKLLFEQNINLEALKAKIQTQASYYIPNIKVLEVIIELSEDRHIIFITISNIFNISFKYPITFIYFCYYIIK